MVEPYEDLVKEYLEMEGYFVRQGVRYGNKQELDIFAVKLRPRREILVAEVSARYPTTAWVNERRDKLMDEGLSRFVKEETGTIHPRRKIFYWLNKSAGRQEQRIKNQLGKDIESETLQEVIQFLRQSVPKVSEVVYFREKPFLTLLQLLA
jgi:hypothetical protein